MELINKYYNHQSQIQKHETLTYNYSVEKHGSNLEASSQFPYHPTKQRQTNLPVTPLETTSPVSVSEVETVVEQASKTVT